MVISISIISSSSSWNLMVTGSIVWPFGGKEIGERECKTVVRKVIRPAGGKLSLRH